MTVAVPRRLRLLAAVLGLELVVAGTTVAHRAPDGAAPASVARGRPPVATTERVAAVRALLERRAAAVLTRDRAAFLADVDPASTGFLERQAGLFDDLAGVPLTAWTYAVEPAAEEAGDPVLDARYGTWWAPRVVLGVALEGIDADPAESRQALTFVRRQDRWYLAADDDFAARGSATARELWDGGPVAVVRGARSLVLGHPASLEQMRRTADEVDAAVPRVSAVWGTDWSQRVAVVVPADAAELARLVTTSGSLAPLAALAVAVPVRGGTALGGDRVLVNPPNLAVLSDVGRRVVLAHEVTHVASRAWTGPATPSWLSEGLADEVGFRDTQVPVRVAATELAAQVRAGRLPAALPADAAFSTDDAGLSAAYQQAWSAVRLLVRTYGTPAVVAFYRDLGRRADTPGAVDEALRERLGTDLTAFTAAWRADLEQQLS